MIKTQIMDYFIVSQDGKIIPSSWPAFDMVSSTVTKQSAASIGDGLDPNSVIVQSEMTEEVYNQILGGGNYTILWSEVI